MKIFRYISLLIFFVTADVAGQQLSGFQKFIGTVNCKDQLVLSIDKKLTTKIWTPIAVSVPNRSLSKGIQFYDSRSQSLYKIYSTEGETVFTEENYSDKLLTTKTFNQKAHCQMQPKKPELINSENSIIDGFADAKFVQTISKNKWGVIYFWTPSMPLSVLGISEIKKVVRKMGGSLVVLLDPNANIIDIQNLLQNKRILLTETERATSIQLTNLDIKMHYPGILVFKDGKVSNRTYLGYKKWEMYASFIKSELSQIDKDVF